MNGLKIHKFSGTYEEVRDDIGVNDSWFSNNFSAHESSGWKATRAAGILAVLMASYPQMSLDEIAAWAWWNDLADWNFSVDTADSTLLSSGTIVFLDEYPWPSDGGSLFKDWAAGYDIGEGSIDNRYIDPSLVTAAPQPAPAPVQPQPTYYVPSQPAPVLQPASQPMQPATQTLQPASAPATSAPINPPAQQPAPVLNPASMTTPTAQKPKAEEGLPWGIILLGGAALFIAMSGKKKGRR